ncbi:MAG: D-aminoacyl-tRNA deacylase [Archaeoglobaceae archaeon]
MKLVVCSRKDTASMNILDALLSMEDAERRSAGEFEIYEAEDLLIAVVEERLIYADYIDERLSKFVEFDEILFASRHSSKDRRKMFSVHVSGNVATAEYGGRPFSLAKPSPITMKNYFLHLAERLERKPEFSLTLEVTHHGPSEIRKPSAFYEIGSDEEAWRDREAAEIVAEAMLEAVRDERSDWTVAVGVGGTHYAPRQTEIELQTTIAFAHNFAKYTFDQLTPEFLKKAIEISEARLLVYDEKSVVSKVKNMLREVADECGVELLKTKEAKRKFERKSY